MSAWRQFDITRAHDACRLYHVLSEDLLFAARNLNIGDCDCGGVQVVSGNSFVAHGSTGCSPI